MYVAILAGGVGTRLWPRSRQAQPKQFSDITGTGRSMIQMTFDRISEKVCAEQVYVVTGEPYVDLTHQQLDQIPRENIIGEPSGRNTGPAIGLACMRIQRRDPNAVVAFLHADQSIPDVAQFQAVLERASEAAAQGHIVTLGVEPVSPHTGYGYICRSTELNGLVPGELPVYQVERFLEKPDRPTAEAFLADGRYYWNGGIFVCRVDCMLAEFERQLPDVLAHLKQIDAAMGTNGSGGAWQDIWETMPSVSIDHGIMENAQRVAVVPLNAGWNDVGSWDSLEIVRPLNGETNCVAQGELLPIESAGNIIYSDKLVALVGVENLVVVDTGDALLVGDKRQMQKVKKVVEELQNRGRTDLL